MLNFFKNKKNEESFEDLKDFLEKDNSEIKQNDDYYDVDYCPHDGDDYCDEDCPGFDDDCYCDDDDDNMYNYQNDDDNDD